MNCTNKNLVPVQFEDTGEPADSDRYYPLWDEYQERNQVFGPWFTRPEPTAMNPTQCQFSDFVRSHQPFLWSQQGATQPAQHVNTLLQPSQLTGSIQARIESFDVSILGDAMGELSPSSQDDSRWKGLLRKLRKTDLDAIYPPADVSCDLPTGIDLTTVEILTFFPSYMKDTFFLYRCISVGWDTAGMAHAYAAHYKTPLAADMLNLSAKLLENFKMNISFVLNVQRENWSITAHKRVPVGRRPKLSDYTSTTFATMFAAANDWHRDYEPISDLRLSDLAAFATCLPQGADAGTLTALVHARKEGKIEDLRMSQIDRYVADRMHWKVNYGASEDEERAFTGIRSRLPNAMTVCPREDRWLLQRARRGAQNQRNKFVSNYHFV